MHASTYFVSSKALLYVYPESALDILGLKMRTKNGAFFILIY